METNVSPLGLYQRLSNRPECRERGEYRLSLKGKMFAIAFSLQNPCSFIGRNVAFVPSNGPFLKHRPFYQYVLPCLNEHMQRKQFAFFTCRVANSVGARYFTLRIQVRFPKRVCPITFFGQWGKVWLGHGTSTFLTKRWPGPCNCNTKQSFATLLE